MGEEAGELAGEVGEEAGGVGVGMPSCKHKQAGGSYIWALKVTARGKSGTAPCQQRTTPTLRRKASCAIRTSVSETLRQQAARLPVLHGEARASSGDSAVSWDWHW